MAGHVHIPATAAGPGGEDAPQSLKGGAGKTGGPSFATVANVRSECSFSTIHLAARQYGSKDGKPSISFTTAELQVGVDNLKHTLVAKFSGGRLPLDEVRQSFLSSWSLTGKCSISAWDAKHILIVLNSEQDACKVLSHPMRKLGHSLFRIFRWSKDFSTRREPSITSTWIRLASLPLQLYNPGYIEAIVSAFGRFLAVDNRTVAFSNPNYARVCIEMDITKVMPDEVWISTGADSGFWQKIVYENSLQYCDKCKLHGHNLMNCRKVKKRQEEEHRIREARDDYGLPIIKPHGTTPQEQVKDKSLSSTMKAQTLADEKADGWQLVQKRKDKNPQKKQIRTPQQQTQHKEHASQDIGACNKGNHSFTCPEEKVKSMDSTFQTGSTSKAHNGPDAQVIQPNDLNKDCVSDIAAMETTEGLKGRVERKASKEVSSCARSGAIGPGKEQSQRDSSDSDDWSASDESQEEDRSSIHLGKIIQAFQMIKGREPKKKDAIKSQRRLRKDKLEALKRTYIEALERTK